MTLQGRRIGARSRYRTGNLMQSDGTVDGSINPDDPGIPDPNTDTGTIGVDADLSVTL